MEKYSIDNKIFLWGNEYSSYMELTIRNAREKFVIKNIFPLFGLFKLVTKHNMNYFLLWWLDVNISHNLKLVTKILISCSFYLFYTLYLSRKKSELKTRALFYIVKHILGIR